MKFIAFLIGLIFISFNCLAQKGDDFLYWDVKQFEMDYEE